MAQERDSSRPHLYKMRLINTKTRELFNHPNPTPTTDKAVLAQQRAEALQLVENPEDWDVYCIMSYTDDTPGDSE
jgi:hypothetical protein